MTWRTIYFSLVGLCATATMLAAEAQTTAPAFPATQPVLADAAAPTTSSATLPSVAEFPPLPPEEAQGAEVLSTPSESSVATLPSTTQPTTLASVASTTNPTTGPSLAQVTPPATGPVTLPSVASTTHLSTAPAVASSTPQRSRLPEASSTKAKAVPRLLPVKPYPEAYAMLLERSIFSRERSRGRSPFSSSGSPGSSGNSSGSGSTGSRVTDAVLRAESDIVLRGVLEQDRRYSAYFENLDSNAIREVQLGDSLANGKVSGIDLNAVEYQSNGHTQRVLVGQNLRGVSEQTPMKAFSSTQPSNGGTTGDRTTGGRTRGGRTRGDRTTGGTTAVSGEAPSNASPSDNATSGSGSSDVLEKMRLRRAQETGTK